MLKEQESAMAAKSLLDHPLLQKILRDLREQTISAWHKTRMNATQQRENAYHLMLAIDQLENQLISLVETGELATERLKRIRKPRKGA